MTPTCKAFAGLATAGKRPPKSNSEIISNAIISMLMITIIIMVGGGSNPYSRAPQGPTPDLYSHHRRLEIFFLGYPNHLLIGVFDYAGTTENPDPSEFGEGEPI
nr:MAG TPA: hypothetical protein [Caudoviricetes sp.]